MPVISAPESVVGIAATRGPADRGDRLRGVDDTAAAEGDDLRRLHAVEQGGGGLRNLARRDRVDGACAAASSSGALGRARGVRQQLELGEAVLEQELRRLGDAVLAQHDDAAGVAPDEASVHPVWAERGLTTGRRFGSTSSRRCS